MAEWLKIPETPVTVMVDVPNAAEALAVMVNVLALAVLTGLKEAVTPVGNPDTVRLTLLLKPFCGLTWIALPLLEPCFKLMLLGEAESAKFGVPVTVRPMVVVWLTLPDTPVTVMVVAPVVAEALAVRINVLAPVVLAGLKEAVTPLGKPETVRLTLPMKPFCGTTAMLPIALAPGFRLIAAGEGVREKFGPAATERAIVVALLKLPEVPVMVTVDVPTAADALAASVSVSDPGVLDGLNDAVTPEGSPVTTKLMVPLKPF